MAVLAIPLATMALPLHHALYMTFPLCLTLALELLPALVPLALARALALKLLQVLEPLVDVQEEGPPCRRASGHMLEEHPHLSVARALGIPVVVAVATCLLALALPARKFLGMHQAGRPFQLPQPLAKLSQRSQPQLPCHQFRC